ncbi:hypothetical protein Trydic_g19925, partial [Trypoxylus dichotomus]
DSLKTVTYKQGAEIATMMMEKMIRMSLHAATWSTVLDYDIMKMSLHGFLVF